MCRKLKLDQNNRINILGIDFFYKEDWYTTGGDFESPATVRYTDFYVQNGFKEKLKWSWRHFWFIPSGVKVPKYNKVFNVDFYITKNPYVSKEELRLILEKKASDYKKIVDREKELESKDFI